jgi:hypothetical protein
MTTNLVVLHATLNHIGEIVPWYPGQIVFDTIGKFSHLSYLDMILDAKHIYRPQLWAAVTGGVLLPLSQCPSKTLSILPFNHDPRYTLGVKQVSDFGHNKSSCISLQTRGTRVSSCGGKIDMPYQKSCSR